MSFRKIIPNVFTAANLLSGFSAIIILLVLHNFDWVMIAILLAAAFDMIDGFLARLVKGQSLFGKEFDSMADLVSFGVAPAMMLFSVSYYNQSPESIFDTLILGLPSLIYVLAAALRLAWFNSDSAQSKDFKGLASPAAAIALVGLLTYSKETFLSIDNGILYVSVLISAMMLIPVRVLSLKVNASKIHIFFAIIMALTAATMIIVYGLGALWLVVLIYYAGGIIVYYLSRKILKK